MKKIDISAVKIALGSAYPEPYGEPCRQRQRSRLGDAAGLTHFGVNHLRLPPGVWSSQRHWHSAEDEFVYILEGEVVLEVGSRNPERDGVDYPDIDLTIPTGERTFLHRDGKPYPPRPR